MQRGEIPAVVSYQNPAISRGAAEMLRIENAVISPVVGVNHIVTAPPQIRRQADRLILVQIQAGH